LNLGTWTGLNLGPPLECRGCACGVAALAMVAVGAAWGGHPMCALRLEWYLKDMGFGCVLSVEGLGDEGW
jgi:hypothetical protein